MTLVVDAGAVVDFVLRRPTSDDLGASMREHDGDLHAPELQVCEALSALRKLEQRGSLSAARAASALDDLLAMPVDLHPHAPLAARSWELRANFTPYDATYVALAEVLGAELLTLDARLARAATTHTNLTVLSPEAS